MSENESWSDAPTGDDSENSTSDTPAESAPKLENVTTEVVPGVELTYPAGTEMPAAPAERIDGAVYHVDQPVYTGDKRNNPDVGEVAIDEEKSDPTPTPMVEESVSE